MKKNRKISLVIAIILVGFIYSSKLSAQASASSTVNIVLANVSSIKVNAAQTSVALNFSNADDYNNGVSLAQVQHLEVTCTGGYQVTVKASGPTMINGASTIPVSTITLTPSISSGSTDAGAAFTPVSLSATPQNMITTPNGATKIYYDLRYKASGGPQYIGKAAGTYTTTITFTIVAA
jgi:hypothetical protein